MNKSIRQAKLPTKPELPPSLLGYQSVFSSYSRELLKYYQQTTLSLALLFSDGVGAFQHLFLISGVEIPYLAFMTCCYHLGIEGNTIRTMHLLEYYNHNKSTVNDRIKQAYRLGHIVRRSHGAYLLSEVGREYVEEQGRIFYDKVMDLYDLK